VVQILVNVIVDILWDFGVVLNATNPFAIHLAEVMELVLLQEFAIVRQDSMEVSVNFQR